MKINRQSKIPKLVIDHTTFAAKIGRKTSNIIAVAFGPAMFAFFFFLSGQIWNGVFLIFTQI